MDVIELQDIVKSYAMGDTVVMALNHVSVKFEQSKFTSIVGPSGSGKSTMMNILGCLDRPTSGHYLLEGKDIAKYSDDELARTRNQRIGFVFQSFNLLSRLTAVENVALPLIYAGVKLAERTERAEKSPGSGGAGQAAVPQAQRDERRPAAAGGHCPGPDQQPGHYYGRRTHRQPGHKINLGNH